jgi:FHS family Na+ dependent glucose MFS transporter 1
LETETISTIHTPQERGGVISKTAAYYVAFIALGTAGAVLGPTLGDLAEHTRTQLSQISLLFTATSLGYLLGSLLSGRLYDRAPGHPVMAAGLFVLAAMLGLAPLAPLLWLLIAAFVILGVAQAAVDVGGNTLLVWIHGDKVPPFMNGLHFCFGLGAFLTPIVVNQSDLLSEDIIWAFWVLALFMLPIAAWLLRLTSPAGQSVSEDGSARPADHRLLALIVAFFFLHVGAEISYGGWIATYAESAGLTSEAGARYLNSAFWGAFTLSRLMSIPVALRFRPGTILLGGLLGCVGGLTIILLWPDSSTALWVGTIGMGTSIAPMFPTSISLAERRMAITGQVTGWFLVGASIGSMSIPLLIGQLFEPIGPQVVIGIILIDVILALGILMAIRRTTRPLRQATGAV